MHTKLYTSYMPVTPSTIRGAPNGPFTFAALRAAFRAGRSPVELIEAAYARIAALGDNPVWIYLVPRAQALARAAELARLPRTVVDKQPLYGIPFAVKDNIDVEGLPTTAACPAFAYRAARSATAVQRLLDAGAILLGKTNLDQFATGLVGTRSPYGTCRNAYDPRYISGGSSAGSAVAVAAGLCSFALGTDTAGSGRVPAAFNNVVGLKPTRGLVSGTGVVPACRSLDCVSVFASSCRDASEVFGVLEGRDLADPYSRPASEPVGFDGTRFRFAVPALGQLEFFGDTEYARLFAAATGRLAALGGEAIEIDFAPFLEAQALLYGGPWIAERSAELGAFIAAHRDAVLPVTRRVIESAARFSAADAFAAQHRLAALKRATEAVWQRADVLLVPGAPTIYTVAQVEADPIELNARLGLYTNFVNLLDLAALTVPAGFRADGLPFGITLVAPAFSDRALAALGARLLGEAPLAVPAPGRVRLAVVGAHLSGMPLNYQLSERGARLLRVARTAPAYRLYVLDGQTPAKPGMVRSGSGETGARIELEIWELPLREFGSFVDEVAPPLGIGTLQLEDGEQVKGFLCEHYAVAGHPDITGYGGWRAYLRGRGDDPS